MNVISGMWKVLIFAICALEIWADPLTLDQATKEAIDQNLTITAERYNLEIAEARMITAGLRPNPVLTISADHNDWLGTGYGPKNNAGPPEYAARVDYLFERGRKRDQRLAVAAQDRRVAEFGFREAMRQLIFKVQSAFVDILLAKEQLALSQDSLRALNDIVQVNTARVRAGDLAAVELTRSRLAALQFQTAVQQNQLRLQQAKTQLQALLGRAKLEDSFDVSGDFRRDAIPKNLDQVRTGALDQRPDLSQLKSAEARSLADVKLQLAQRKVDFTLGTEVRRQDGSPLYSSTGNSIGVFMSVPLQVFNRNQGEILRAQREAAQAATRVKATESAIKAEVKGAWEQYQSSKELLDKIESTMLSEAKEVRQVTDYSYRRGEATFIEFLDAQRAFNDVMESYNVARAEYARSLYLIDAVAGGATP